MAYSYGNTIDSKWRSYCLYTITETGLMYTVKVTAVGMQTLSSYTSSYLVSTSSATGYTQSKVSKSNIGGSANYYPMVTSLTYSWNKASSSATKTITFTAVSGGKTSTGTLTVTVPAKNTYTVTFNANGGTNAPPPQTKIHGTDLTLTTAKPTRQYYTFVAWNTVQYGTGTSIASGGKYTFNESKTLYAQWKVTYTKPTIANLIVDRVDSAGDPDEDGEYLKISMDYQAGKSDSTPVAPSCVVKIDDVTQASGLPVSVTGGSTYAIYGTFDPEVTHNISVQIYDTVDSSGVTRTAAIGAKAYPIDILGDSSAMGLMMPAVEGIPLSTTWLDALKLSVQGVPLLTVENGTISGWQYEKRSDGVLEAWYNFPSSTITPTVWATPIYYAEPTIMLPALGFTSITHVDVTPKTGQWWLVGLPTVATNSLKMRICRAASSAAAFACSIYIKGRWD